MCDWQDRRHRHKPRPRSTRSRWPRHRPRSATANPGATVPPPIPAGRAVRVLRSSRRWNCVERVGHTEPRSRTSRLPSTVATASRSSGVTSSSCSVRSGSRRVKRTADVRRPSSSPARRRRRKPPPCQHIADRIAQPVEQVGGENLRPDIKGQVELTGGKGDTARSCETPPTASSGGPSSSPAATRPGSPKSPLTPGWSSPTHPITSLSCSTIPDRPGWKATSRRGTP